MLRNWLERLRGEPNATEASDDASHAPEATAVPAFVARRPLISGRGEIAGFEFRLNDATQWQLINLADAEAETTFAVALLGAMRATTQSGRIAYAVISSDLLIRPEVAEQIGPRMMLCVRPPDAPMPGTIERIDALRMSGALIGWQGAWLAAVPRRPRADFVSLQYVGGAIDGLLAAKQQWVQLIPGVSTIATDIASIDDLELAVRSGVSLASGTIASSREPRDVRPLAPHTQRICRLLNHVVLDAGNARIVEQIRIDVALSYRLLRYLNSAAFGLTRKIESIEQAVVLLGRNELYRFLSMLLIGAAEGRRLSHALQEIALTRGRLLELLAIERGTDPHDGLFTVGMFSLLDALFQTPLAQALEPLQLAAPAQQALLEARGPWRRYLDIALALEQHDFARVAELGDGFGVGGAQRIIAMADAAADWARTVSLEGGL